MKPRILIALPLPEVLVGRLSATCQPVFGASGIFPDRTELKALAPGLDGAIITVNSRFDAELLALCGRLRALSNCAVGTDNIDLDLATTMGVAVCNTPGVQDVAVAELAIALVMSLSRNLVSNDAYVRSGEWHRKRTAPLGGDIRGKVFGLIGMGGIGRNAARLATALGMESIYYKRSRDMGAEAGGIVRFMDRDEVFATSDFVSLHLPLNEQTRASVGAAEIARMKPGAFLVNTARGAIVDEAAMIAALQSGHLAGAGLDVMVEEPLPPMSPLCSLPNVILQPHAAGATRETRRGMEAMAVANLLAVLGGQQPGSTVNPEVLDARS